MVFPLIATRRAMTRVAFYGTPAVNCSLWRRSWFATRAFDPRDGDRRVRRATVPLIDPASTPIARITDVILTYS